MKSKISAVSLFIFIFVSSASFAQYKYDIGVRASSYDMEALQLEQRFHFDNPYSIVATIATGSRGSYNYSQTPVYSDSLVTTTSDYYSARNVCLKVGVQRKLSFFATDVFYAGAALGFGMEDQLSRNYSGTFSVHDSLAPYPHLLYGYDQEINASTTVINTRAINAQLALSFGMDVPITKRFLINVELGFAGIYQNSLNYPTSIITFRPSISGGLRYQFGKRG